jgi:hypothetical protein
MSHDAEAAACAEALHSPPSHPAVAEASTWMLNKLASCCSQLWRSEALMKLPLQTRAAFELHCAWQPPWSIAVHIAEPLAWHMMSQLRFAWPLQLPWQLAWQPAAQLTMPGVPMHDTLQRAPQLALHWAVHVASSSPFGRLIPEQAAEQLPLQVASQFPWQLIIGALAVQSAMQLPSQLV